MFIPFKLQLIDDWKRAHHFASVQLSALLALIYSVLPVVADQWSGVAPTFVSWFPKNGQQWAPIIGCALVILARITQKAPPAPSGQ